MVDGLRDGHFRGPEAEVRKWRIKKFVFIPQCPRTPKVETIEEETVAGYVRAGFCMNPRPVENCCTFF